MEKKLALRSTHASRACFNIPIQNLIFFFAVQILETLNPNTI